MGCVLEYADVLSFLSDIESLCLSKEEMVGSGVSLPISENFDFLPENPSSSWEFLCFVCLWVYLRRGSLPDSVESRMLLGPVSRWVRIYVLVKASKDSQFVQAQGFFDLAG